MISFPSYALASDALQGTFTINRRDGRRVTVGQAFALMQPHGELDKCETSTNLAPDGVPSVTVHFKMYDPSRDLVAVSIQSCYFSPAPSLNNHFRHSGPMKSIESSPRLIPLANPSSVPRIRTKPSWPAMILTAALSLSTG